MSPFIAHDPLISPSVYCNLLSDYIPAWARDIMKEMSLIIDFRKTLITPDTIAGLGKKANISSFKTI